MYIIPTLLLLVVAGSRFASIEAGSSCDCSSYFSSEDETPQPPMPKMKHNEEEADSDIIFRPDDLITPEVETINNTPPSLNFNFTTDSDITYRPDDLITPEQEIGPMRGLRFYPFSVDFDYESEEPLERQEKIGPT